MKHITLKLTPWFLKINKYLHYPGLLIYMVVFNVHNIYFLRTFSFTHVNKQIHNI